MAGATAQVYELPSPRKRSTMEGELGVTLDLPFGTWNEEIYNPNEINVPDLLPRLDQMQRNDGHMRALYRLLSLPFRRAEYRIEEADGGGEEEADLVKQMFTRPPYEGGMSTSFDYIRALGSKAMVNGFQVFEKVWDTAEVPGHGMCTVLRKLAPRAAKTVRFRADANGGFDGVVQRAYAPQTGYRQVLIPKEKVFFFTVDKEEHPFYGRSMFEPALYHYDKKHKLYYIAHIAAQMGAVPGRLGYEDEGDLTPDQKIEFRTALANFGFNTAMMVPRGFRVEAFESKSNVAGDILSLINHHNIQSSQSVLGQFLDLSQGESATGSYALSKDGSDLFIMCMETLLGSWAEHLSWYVIPDIIDNNFATKKYPTFCFDPLADDMKAALAAIFETIVSAKFPPSSDFMFELEKQVAEKLGLDIDYDKIEKEREQAKQQQDVVTQAVADLYKKGGLGGPDAPGGPAGGGGGQPSPNAPKPSLAAVANLAEHQIAIELASNRDKLGKFARINELGSGAGKKGTAQGQYAPIVADVQTKLGRLGYKLSDETEGEFGHGTTAAVKQFQVDSGLPGTGRLDLGTYSLLLSSHSKAMSSGQTPHQLLPALVE